jgi:hypothetical protein
MPAWEQLCSWERHGHSQESAKGTLFTSRYLNAPIKPISHLPHAAARAHLDVGPGKYDHLQQSGGAGEARSDCRHKESSSPLGRSQLNFWIRHRNVVAVRNPEMYISTVNMFEDSTESCFEAKPGQSHRHCNTWGPDAEFLGI